MMIKFVSSTSAVGVKILLAVGDSALRQIILSNFKPIFSKRCDRPSKPTTKKIRRLSERQPKNQTAI